LEGFQAKSVENIVSSIQQSKERPFEKLLFALGIRFVGETVARKLAEYFGSMDQLMSATAMELLMVDEIGERITESLLAYFADPLSQELIQRLRKHGLQFEMAQSSELFPDILQGKSVVVSGKFSRQRDDLKKLISQYGGKNVSAISKSTDFLLAGDSMGPAKLKKATDLEIKIISEDDFIAMIENNG
jgi:DNA ligase (NAD+)